MKNRITLYVVAVTVVALFLTPACYTLLRHPRVKRVVYEEVTDRRCNSCHRQEEVWAFHHPPNQRFLRVLEQPVWNRYYNIPWWYNEDWYYDQDPTSADAPAFTTGAGRIPAEQRVNALRTSRGRHLRLRHPHPRS